MILLRICSDQLDKNISNYRAKKMEVRLLDCGEDGEHNVVFMEISTLSAMFDDISPEPLPLDFNIILTSFSFNAHNACIRIDDVCFCLHYLLA